MAIIGSKCLLMKCSKERNLSLAAYSKTNFSFSLRHLVLKNLGLY
uniref:Uncharacterized protein n=1 Tax=Lepeophtheirus salmonis TaxID=72036 RepID=A0A0K2UGT9_LEPSM